MLGFNRHLSDHELFLSHAEMSAVEDFERIEKHLFLCEECRESLGRIRKDHPESAVLDLYAIGRLSGPVGIEVRQHLDGCTWCADTMAQRSEKVGRFRDGLTSLLVENPPEEGVQELSLATPVEMHDETPMDEPSGGPARPLSAYESYSLGSKLAPLAALTPDMPKDQAFRLLMNASLELESVAGVLDPVAGDLADAIREAFEDMGAGPGQRGPSDAVIRRLALALRSLERSLVREQGKVDAYLSFGDKTWALLPAEAQRDWTESARCLAAGFSMAAVFHAVRALESVIAVHLHKLDVPAVDRSISGRLALLKARGVDPRAISLAEHATALDKETSAVTEDDAADQFDLIRSAIKALVKDNQRHNLAHRRWA